MSKVNYKRLGDYIREVDVRNEGLKVTNLLGLTINKEFIRSVANTIGTDMEKYKIIRKNQFACSTMQVRRDGKMPIALLKEEEAIISQAYPVFEVIDEKEFLPDYLMMWFTRSEFDREACFHAVGGVRGSIEWEDFLNMQLPIPSIEKQREIVAEYNAVQKRIDLNNQLIQKLEEIAQAIYKQWFVEFAETEERVPLKQYIELNPKLKLKKGSIAAYVEMANLSEVTMCISGKIYRDFNGGSRFQNKDTLLARITPCLENGKTGFVDILKKDEISAGSTEFIVMRAKKNISPYWVYCLAKDEGFRSYAISSMVGSSGRQRVHEKYLEEYLIPSIQLYKMVEFDRMASSLFKRIGAKSKENNKLNELQSLLLSKMARGEE